ncbi:xanthine dehydrogenase accessory protein XdhC [Ancylobacter sp. VNQ12]|uniref:xanthine dehydrogenase accessory protein XdhC n=1 Tax=Ancylobacter sp. VNQ12 TaxID=3400920 RepID=UPI003C02D933
MIRVRVVRARGSTPREEGAEMFVGRDAASGTIGGGHLEYMAIDRARQMLERGEATASMDVALGPEIGQCCGGRVELAFDRARPAPAEPGPPVLIFGAGHVGRALAVALAPLPLSPRLIDTRAAELSLAPAHVATTLSALPEVEIRAAPPGAAYVILTHDHALDFMLAVEALKRGDAGYVGMIGSRTKKATFLNHAAREGIDAGALVCPIAAESPRDKRPEVIAAFAAAELLSCLLARPATPVEAIAAPTPSVFLVD